MWRHHTEHMPSPDGNALSEPLSLAMDFEPNVCCHGRALAKCCTCAEQVELDRLRVLSRLSTSPSSSRLKKVTEECGIRSRVKTSPVSNSGGLLTTSPTSKKSGTDTSTSLAHRFDRRVRSSRNFSLGHIDKTRLPKSQMESRASPPRVQHSRTGCRTSPAGLGSGQVIVSPGFGNQISGSMAASQTPSTKALRGLRNTVVENQHKSMLKKLTSMPTQRKATESAQYLIYNTERLCSTFKGKF